MMSGEGARSPGAAELSRRAASLYATQRGVTGFIQTLRPHICPFENLIDALPHAARVLDVGCGSGLFLGLAVHSGKLRNGVGFDADDAAIAIAQTIVLPQAARDRLIFQHLRVEEEWPPGPFDVVSMIDVMHHLPTSARDRAIRNVAHALKPGGLFLYKDISGADLPRAFMNRLHDLLMAREWVRYMPQDTVRALAQSHGLRERHYERINRLWYGHDLHIFELRDETKVEEGE